MSVRRVSRRAFMGALGAFAGATALRCGGDEWEEPTGTRQPGDEPKRGGVIRLATTAPAISLDPHVDVTLGAIARDYMYGFLVHVTDWCPTKGDVAESWEVVDDVNWVFHIRPGLRFHNLPPVNGRQVVAGDVVYSFDRVTEVSGGSLVGWTEWIESYEAPDDRTLRVRTTKPYAYMLTTMGSPSMAIVAREAVEHFGDLRSNAIGSGPFLLQAYDRNAGIEVSRNPDYYQAGIPYVDGISWTVMTDDAAIQAAFRSGSIDLYGAPNKMIAQNLGSMPGVVTAKFLNRLYAVLVLNAVNVPAFADIRVREAVDLALDRKALIDKVCLGDAELAGPVGPTWDTALPADEVEKAYRRDVQKARQLLSAAGAEGLTFELSCSDYADNVDRAAVIRESLEEAGIRANVRVKELGTWLADLFAVNFEATTYAHLPYLSDDIQLQSHHTMGLNRQMFFGVTDKEMDARLEEIQSTIDEERRRELARDVQRAILKRHGPTLVLYEPYSYALIYEYIKNYKPSPFVFGMYKYDMWIDKG